VERTKYVHGCPQPSIAANLVDGPGWERVCEVLRNPAMIERELAKHRSGGGLDRDLADLDAEADIAEVRAQLRLLTETQKTLEADRDDLLRRIEDTEADRARVRSLTDLCQEVGRTLATATFEQKWMALEALGVKVRIYRAGTLDEDGNPYSRWVAEMRPIGTGEPIMYTPRRCG
jgi:hypothetical protein